MGPPSWFVCVVGADQPEHSGAWGLFAREHEQPVQGPQGGSMVSIAQAPSVLLLHILSKWDNAAA